MSCNFRLLWTLSPCHALSLLTEPPSHPNDDIIYVQHMLKNKNREHKIMEYITRKIYFFAKIKTLSELFWVHPYISESCHGVINCLPPSPQSYCVTFCLPPHPPSPKCMASFMLNPLLLMWSSFEMSLCHKLLNAPLWQNVRIMYNTYMFFIYQQPYTFCETNVHDVLPAINYYVRFLVLCLPFMYIMYIVPGTW